MPQKTVLLIDDELIILKSLKDQVASWGSREFRVEIAESAEEGLEIYKEFLEQGLTIPVVISDYIMPNIKGDELLSMIHSLSPKTKTILLTGQASLEGAINAINNANLYRFIAKPWNADDLKLTVENAVNLFYLEKEIEEKNKSLAIINEKLERRIQAFNKFVPREFLNLMHANPEEEYVGLGRSVEVEITVMFIDIRSFTRLSLEMAPKEVFEIIGSYLNLLTPIIRRHNGFIDKFIGDAIMAIFELPDNAVLCTAEIMRKMKTFNQMQQNAGKRIFHIGIAVNTGLASLGTLGDENYMETTLLGSVVNVASKLESLNNKNTTDCRIGGETVNKLLKKDYPLISLGNIDMRSLNAEIPIWTLDQNAI